MGNQRQITADWPSVHIELHTQYARSATGTAPPATIRPRAESAGIICWALVNASGRPSVTVLGAMRIPLRDVRERGRHNGQARNNGEVCASGAEVAALGQRDSQKGGRTQRRDQFRAHRTDRHTRRDIRQQTVERQPDRQLDQHGQTPES